MINITIHSDSQMFGNQDINISQLLSKYFLFICKNDQFIIHSVKFYRCLYVTYQYSKYKFDTQFGQSLQACQTESNRKYLPLTFIKVKILINNDKYVNHLLCIALEYLRVVFDNPQKELKKRFQMSNRECYQLNLYHQTVFDVNNIKHPLFMPHACMLKIENVIQCFGDNIRNKNGGLCKIEGDNLIHNCRLNRIFFLDPYVSRLVGLLYYIAYYDIIKNQNEKKNKNQKHRKHGD